MRAVIFANGDIFDYDAIKAHIRDNDYIVCADGGLRHTVKMNIKADILIGDMDSLKIKSDTDTETVKLPVRKDFTDSEVCVDFAISKGFNEIIMLGMTGTRFDHTVANITLLKKCADAHIKCTVINENNEITYITAGVNEYFGKKGDLFSIIPLCGDISGITTDGLEYPLYEDTLKFGETRGVSNVFLSDKCIVKIDKGFGLAIKSRD